MASRNDDSDGAGRLYYNQRAGAEPPKLTFAELREQVVATYRSLESGCWFQGTFGYECVDDGYCPGAAGRDPALFIFRKTWINNMWPLDKALEEAERDTLFTLVELLFDCVSRPVQGRHHDWNGCGWHYHHFDQPSGQTRWREEMNHVLQFFEEGFELSLVGEVQKLGAAGVRELLKQPLPKGTPRNDREKVENAVRAYRHFSATRAQRIDAVRNLVDVLELYRQQLKVSELSADEKDLYNIANNFAIRHYNKGMKDQYSDDFVDWLFHMYLATVHLMLRLVHGSEPTAPESQPPGDLDEDFPF